MLKKISSLSLLALLAACSCGTETCQNVDGSMGGASGNAGDFKQNVRDRVYYSFDSAKLTPEAHAILDQQAAWFKVHSSKESAPKAIIEGHCDQRGSVEYNLALGEHRAHAAHDYLVDKGVSKDVLSVKSYGKNNPPVPDASDEKGYAQNRVAITVVQ